MYIRKILGQNQLMFYGVIAFAIAGLLVGSIEDLEFSFLVASRNPFAEFCASYGCYLPLCVFPAAGIAIFKGLKKLGKIIPGWIFLVVSYFLAIYLMQAVSGGALQNALGNSADNVVWPVLGSYLIWTALFGWVPPVIYFLLDDEDPKRLVTLGAAIIIGGLLAYGLTSLFEGLASRPQYNYLKTLEMPLSEYRAWWQWAPFSNADAYHRSFPSSSVTVATFALGVPSIVAACKKTNQLATNISYICVCAYIIGSMYNKVQLGSGFLSDVSFSLLITSALLGIPDYFFQLI